MLISLIHRHYQGHHAMFPSPFRDVPENSCKGDYTVMGCWKKIYYILNTETKEMESSAINLELPSHMDRLSIVSSSYNQ